MDLDRPPSKERARLSLRQYSESVDVAPLPWFIREDMADEVAPFHGAAAKHIRKGLGLSADMLKVALAACACLLLSIGAMAPSMEQDKAKHLAAGFLIGAAVTTTAEAISQPHGPWWPAVAGLSASIAAGVAKEIMDDRHRDRHTVDPMDAAYTAVGGMIGSGLAAGLTIAIGKDGAAVGGQLSW